MPQDAPLQGFAEQYANVNTPQKDKLGYWHKKFRHMRRAKALKPPTMRALEMREEEAFREGLARKNTNSLHEKHPANNRLA